MNTVRAQRLKYNLEKQGVKCAYVMVQDARNLDEFFSFDKILLDAPCSGSGTINIQDSNLEKIFTTKLIQKTTKAQLSLLRKAINILKTGKEMIYSTCSILEKENEEILQKALEGTKAKIIPINLKNIEEIPLLPVKLPGTICIAPSELYEGFFIAKIRKE